MIQSINTIEDVKNFLNQLNAEGLNFHPDNDFADYINTDTEESTYSEEDANLHNNLMSQAFDVCEQFNEDIYRLSLEIFFPSLHTLDTKVEITLHGKYGATPLADHASFGGDRMDIGDIQNVGKNKYTATMKSYDLMFDNLSPEDASDAIVNELNEMFVRSGYAADVLSVFIL